jgi:hypothetical protein
MFKSFKISIGGSKKDCCSISIQEVKNDQEETKDENKECCEIKVETNPSCCN